MSNEIKLSTPTTVAEQIFYAAFDGKCDTGYPEHIERNVRMALRKMSYEDAMIADIYFRLALDGKPKTWRYNTVAGKLCCTQNQAMHKCMKIEMVLHTPPYQYVLANGKEFGPGTPGWEDMSIFYLGMEKSALDKVVRDFGIVTVKKLINIISSSVYGKDTKVYKQVVSSLAAAGFEVPGLNILVSRTCPMCGKDTTLLMTPEEYEGYSIGRESVQKLFETRDKFFRETAINGMCYDCQSKMFNVPKPGEDWGPMLSECEQCGAEIYEKDGYVCPVCGYMVSK